MPTYKDIQDAFARSCETGNELRFSAYTVAGLVFSKLVNRGDMKDVLHLHPADEPDLDRKSTFMPAGATHYDPQARSWEIGFWLDVRVGQAIVPREILRFTVTLKQAPAEYTVAFSNSHISKTFNPSEAADMDTKLDAFADEVIGAIAKHYDAQRAFWLNEDQGQNERIIGFSSNG